MTAKVPSTPRDQSAGVVAALEAAARARRPTVGGLRARHDGGHERAARAPRRADGAGHHRGLPRRARDRPPGPRRPLRPHGAAGRSRWSRASCASRCASGWGPTACSSRSTRTSVRDGGRGACGEADVEAVAVCLLFGFLHPAHEQAVGEALREALPGVHVSLSQRGAAGVPRVRAHRDDRRRRLPRAAARRLPASAGRARARGRAARAARDAVVRRRRRARRRGRQRRRLRALRARPAASSAPPTSARASGFDDVLTFDMGGTSTDVAPIVGGEAQHDHGVGRRRRADRAADGRRPHGLARAAARSRGPTRAARCASGRSSAGADPGPAAYGRGGDGADGDRRQPRPRLPRRRRRARRRGARSTASAAEAALAARSARRSGSTSRRPRRRGARRQRRDGARAAR